jgi:hypothetical protein
MLGDIHIFQYLHYRRFLETPCPIHCMFQSWNALECVLGWSFSSCLTSLKSSHAWRIWFTFLVLASSFLDMTPNYLLSPAKSCQNLHCIFYIAYYFLFKSSLSVLILYLLKNLLLLAVQMKWHFFLDLL